MSRNSLSTAVNWITASPACSRNTLMWRVNVLRWTLGFIYLWFGGLKLFPGLSSAEYLAGTTLEMMSFGYLTPDLSLPLLGLWEAAIGLALLIGKSQRVAVISLYLHAAGTVLPLFLLPELTWSKPPIAASLEGQYIFKNLITIGAALVIGAMTCSNSLGRCEATAPSEFKLL
jgi:uncharacterized membrane protein YphA (DoxX/SURF4 family)